MLPFTSREEKKLFTKYYSTISKMTESDLAVWWCNHVNGFNIFPKLPVHFRMHLKQWLKNKRVENSIRAAKPGAEKLKEINEILSPFYSKESPTATATSVSTLAATVVTLPGTNKTPGSREVSFPVVVRPPVMPQPSQRAMHNRPYTLVDGMLIGNNPGSWVGRGEKSRRKPRKCSKCLETGMYEQNPDHKCTAVGRGRECDYFDDNYKRRCWRCWKHGQGTIDPYNCPATKGDRDDCNEFWPSIKGKCRQKRSPVA